MKKIIPSIFTILNLLSGFFGISFLLTNNYNLIEYCIYLSLFFDFLDGYFARKLNAVSDFGKQLDSFSDIVSFGLLPTLILYDWFINNSSNNLFRYISILILIFSAIRLSKFNLDNRKDSVFYGLPTPVVALFFNSLIFSSDYISQFVSQELLLVLIILFSLMMVVNIPFFSLKFENYSWKSNTNRYTLLLISLILFLMFDFGSFPIIVFVYLFMSFSAFFLKSFSLKK